MTEPRALPEYCIGCGVPLRGGATEHKTYCPIRKLIEEFFPARPKDDNA